MTGGGCSAGSCTCVGFVKNRALSPTMCARCRHPLSQHTGEKLDPAAQDALARERAERIDREIRAAIVEARLQQAREELEAAEAEEAAEDALAAMASTITQGAGIQALVAADKTAASKPEHEPTSVAQATAAAEAAGAKQPVQRKGTVRQITPLGQAMKDLLSADNLAPLTAAFAKIIELAGVKPGSPDFYNTLKSAVLPSLRYREKIVFRCIDKVFGTRIEGLQDCSNLRVVVAGAGPVGLRTAIELALLGANVTVAEKRNRYSRLNILHLWDWVCLDLLNLGATGADILGKSFFHIGTQRLQLLLTTIAMILGVDFRAETKVLKVDEPQQADGLYGVTIETTGKGQERLDANVLIVGDGARSPLAVQLEIARDELGTGEALGIVAHFQMPPGKCEIEEFSLASQYYQEKFQQLRDAGYHLENVVFYDGVRNLCYLVMTPTRASLLQAGVIKNDIKGSAVVGRDNVNQESLVEYARGVAEFFGFPKGMPPMGDGVQLFDFSTRVCCQKSCNLLEKGNAQLFALLVGDALLEPFWPEGLGVNRGFLTALDTAWVVQKHFSSGHTSQPAEAVAERERLYSRMKGLSAFTRQQVLDDDCRLFTLDPKTRYKAL